jgi:hypothetical protein
MNARQEAIPMTDPITLVIIRWTFSVAIEAWKICAQHKTERPLNVAARGKCTSRLSGT